jgi:hypothetical protein
LSPVDVDEGLDFRCVFCPRFILFWFEGDFGQQGYTPEPRHSCSFCQCDITSDSDILLPTNTINDMRPYTKTCIIVKKSRRFRGFFLMIVFTRILQNRIYVIDIFTTEMNTKTIFSIVAIVTAIRRI